MFTIYVYSNELLGDDGQDFGAALIDQHEAETTESCLEWFADRYDYNDYTASFND